MRAEYVFDTAKKRQLDDLAINDFKIPSLTLIRQAADALYQKLKTLIDKKQRIIVFCGPGNNGSDGLALAELLTLDGYNAVVYYFPDYISKASQEILSNCQVVKMSKLDIKEGDLIIDALFGSGIKGEIKAPFADIVRMINQCQNYCIGIDMPSGISADGDNLPSLFVRNDLTLFIDTYPIALFKSPFRTYFKDYILVDINYPETIKAQIKAKIQIIKQADAQAFLPKRSNHQHKGGFKKALLIGGSQKMFGAVTLSGLACLHSGIGTLTFFVPRSYQTFINRPLDAMYIFADEEDGYFAKSAVAQLKAIIADYDIIAIGNGMGRTLINQELLKITLQSQKPVIIDADALWSLKELKDLLKRQAPSILSPHLKEFAHLCDIDVETLKSDPFSHLEHFINKYPQVITLLKSDFTLIANQHQTYLLNQPNSALAKGGSGDVLAGILLGLLAQSADNNASLETCACAAFVHNACANPKYDPNYLTASLMITELNTVYQALRAKN